MPKNIDPSILSIAFSNRDLCTRCGTCTGACPVDAISSDQQLFPVLDPEKCTECALCAETCPGGTLSYRELSRITFNQDLEEWSFDGRTKLSLVGYAKSPTLRESGAGGGVITALLEDLLTHGDVDCCLVTRMNPEKPWVGDSYVASKTEELRQSTGSKYSIIPHNAVLAQVRELDGLLAFAGLPCQIHGLRLLMEKDPALKEKIKIIIGLFCGGALDPAVVTDLLKARRINPKDLQDFQFRGGDWPGKMRAVLKNGEIVDMHYSDYKDGAYNYFTLLYSPFRCLTCLDGSAQFADIAVGDVWTRDKSGNYRFEAHSRMLGRTDRGVKVLERAMERDSIAALDVTTDPDYRTHRAQTKRKGMGVPLRINRLLTRGTAVPRYDLPLDIEATLGERISERLTTGLHFLFRRKRLRFLIASFLTSRWAIPLILLRRFRKKLKYRK